MAQTKNVLGHVLVEVAERVRVCHHDRKKHKIRQGDPCLVVSEGRFSRRNYCATCARPMLELAQAHVAQLVARLGIKLGGA
jgi:hypothetical protein